MLRLGLDDQHFLLDNVQEAMEILRRGWKITEVVDKLMRSVILIGMDALG